MNDSQDIATGIAGGTEARHRARLDRLLRTAARARSLAERIETGCESTRVRALDGGQAELSTLQADAGELKSLADDLVWLGYAFHEVPVAPVFRSVQEWLRGLGGSGQPLQLDVSADVLQIDQRLLPVLRERLQELTVLLLELAAAQRRIGGTRLAARLQLSAGVQGRRLALTLRCDELELGAADLVRAVHDGGLSLEPAEDLLRFPGRLIFSPAFARGWGLPPQWHERLLLLRDHLRSDRGDVFLREGSGGQWEFALQLPLNADLVAVLVVRSGQELFALPIEAVFSTRRVAPSEWRKAENRLWVDQAAPEPVEGFEFADWTTAGPVMAVELSGLLENDHPLAMPIPESSISCVILEDGDGMAAVIVDEILGERQVLLRHPRQLLRRVPLLLGSFLLPSGKICVVLHPWDLLQRARERVRQR